MASSLSAMTAAVSTGAMASSGLAFRDSSLLSRGRLSSFVQPAVSRPLVLGITARRVVAVGSDGQTRRGIRQAMAFDPLGDPRPAPLGGMWDFGPQKARKAAVVAPVRAAASEGEGEPIEEVVPRALGEPGGEGEGLLSKKSLTTGSFFLMWYFLNVVFNILNKKLYNYFPFPYFVSVVHLSVGVVYCLVGWSVGAPKRAPIDNELWKLLTPVAVCHALGHIMSNVSFQAVAVSFTHTIKALEPFFNAAASQFVLGESIPFKLWLSLAPIVLGVSAASLTELSFNWKGFISAMIANVSFTYRNIYSKKAMVGMDSTNVYAYISILSLGMCIPPAIIMEGKALLNYGFDNAITAVGLQKFLSDLLLVGLFYHLYNQLANNTLERVAPLTHAVGNVLKRVFVIVFSILVFGNKISTQTGIGTVVAIAGVAIYSVIKADIQEKQRAAKKSA